jgi:hypothetical protein
MVSGVAAGESKRLEQEVPLEEKEQAKEIKEKKAERKQQRKIKPTTKQRTMLELKRAKDKVMRDVRSGSITKQEAMARLEEIKREYEAIK